MNTDWFKSWAEARHTAYQWPFTFSRCRYYHGQLWQEIGPGRYWCRACYYHRTL